MTITFESINIRANQIGLYPQALNDKCWNVVNKILQGKIYSDYPELISPASTYVAKLLNLGQTNESSALASFVEAHEAMLDALMPVYKQTARYNPKAVANLFPQTIHLFWTAYKTERQQSSYERRKALETMVKEESPELILLIPKLALCNLLTDPNTHSHELLEDHIDKLEDLRAKFKSLKSEDQTALLQKIRGDEVRLENQELYTEIVSFGSTIYQTEKRIFTNIMRHLFMNL